MKKWIQDGYNEWLTKYGYRPVTFLEIYYGDLIKWVDILKSQNALTEVFNKEQNTHNYTLSKLTKNENA